VPRRPTQRTSRVATGPDVPAQVAKDATCVVDLGFHLDAEQHAIRGPVRQDVDPAARTAGADFDLGANLEPVSTELANHHRAASGVNGIPLRRPRSESQTAAIDAESEPEHRDCGGRQVDVERLRTQREESLDRRWIRPEPYRKLAV
jgi:hypothetical protein